MFAPTKTATPSKDKKPSKIKDFTAEQKQQIIAKGNPKIDNNVIKGYN